MPFRPLETHTHVITRSAMVVLPSVALLVIFLSARSNQRIRTSVFKLKRRPENVLQAPPNCVSLSNFRTLSSAQVHAKKACSLHNLYWSSVSSDKSELVCNKTTYFANLRSAGLVSGRQSHLAHEPLCLDTSGTTRLMTSDCLLNPGKFRSFFFVGDSIVREASHSFLRHMNDSDAFKFDCQPWRNDSSLETRTFISLDTDRFSLHYIESWGPIYANLTDMIKSKSKHEGAMVLVSSLNSVHLLRTLALSQNAVGGSVNSEYATILNETITTYYNQIMSIHESSVLVWLSPPKLLLSIMDLPPKKPDMHTFGQFEYLHLWNDIEQEIIRNLRTTLPRLYHIPLFDTYQLYAGLQCDGMHFGTSYDRMTWGCDGFPIVNDLTTQVLLNTLCGTGDAKHGIC